MPGLADRIVRMAEKEQAARHGCEGRNNKVAGWLQIAGQIGALALSCLALYFGYDLLTHDKSVAGYAFFIGAVAALVGTAMYRHKNTNKPPEQ